MSLSTESAVAVLSFRYPSLFIYLFIYYLLVYLFTSATEKQYSLYFFMCTHHMLLLHNTIVTACNVLSINLLNVCQLNTLFPLFLAVII